MSDDKHIIWEEETIPRATQFDDTYYSKADGFLETQYVFIKGNNLIERWQNMAHCTIGELGFGTGLNFLVTALEFQKHAAKNSTLKFISFEQYPLSAEQTKKALSRWPALNEPSKKLINFISNTKFENGKTYKHYFAPNIELKLHMGDANALLPDLPQCIDAWFLDGFSPAKNPELWNETLMQIVGVKTNHNGTFATYTAAGFVRKALNEAGFQITKLKGFAGKRHMCTGVKMAQ